MKLVFAGLEHSIELAVGETAVLQVENAALFARIVRSLQSGQGRYATEPYTFWNGEVEVKPSSAVMLVTDVIRLPWSERSFVAAVTKRIEREYLEDEELRMQVEAA